MGQARQRGTREQREAEAIKRDGSELAHSLGLMDDTDPIRKALKAGLKAFMDRITPDQWQKRRAELLNYLNNRPKGTRLSKATSVRVREDEMGWYLFLCEQAIENPMCTDVSQSQRILPFFASMGFRWRHAHRVAGIERKLDELLKGHRKEPDGLIFEILVALSYAAKGWDVTFIEEGPDKTPDMYVARDDQKFFVECKRMARTTAYSEKERNEFLRLWDSGKCVLFENGQWVWFKGTFHMDPADLPDDFLRDLWQASLPIGLGEQVLLDNDQATIRARLIDSEAVRRHLVDFKVKTNSPMLSQVIGGDWAPDDSSVTILPLIVSAL